MTVPQNLAAVTDVNCHSTYRKGYQSKLLFFHLKGGQCSFWGLLYCDDQRLPWWASSDELQHDHIRSDTVMICMNFNNYASLVIFFIISVLFCFFFWTLNFIYYMSVSGVWFLLLYVSLQSNWVWKFLKRRMFILFFSFEDFHICSRFHNINYGAWYVYKPLFDSSVATCRLASVPKFHFQLSEKS